MYNHYKLILAERKRFICSFDGKVFDCHGNSMEVVYDWVKKQITFNQPVTFGCDDKTKQVIRDGGWKEDASFSGEMPEMYKIEIPQ